MKKYRDEERRDTNGDCEQSGRCGTGKTYDDSDSDILQTVEDLGDHLIRGPIFLMTSRTAFLSVRGLA